MPPELWKLQAADMTMQDAKDLGGAYFEPGFLVEVELNNGDILTICKVDNESWEIDLNKKHLIIQSKGGFMMQ